MTQRFADILDNDEIIKYCYLPSKKKLYVSNFFIISLIMLFICGFMSLAMFVPEEGMEPLSAVYAVVPVGIFVVALLLTWFFTVLYVKKVTYALTNKRIIIRTGIIGVDFKSLDLKSIGATEVYVSFLDKLLGNKTGSIRFGSMSSPINGTNNIPYSFSNILQPYATYKLLKEEIEKAKA